MMVPVVLDYGQYQAGVGGEFKATIDTGPLLSQSPFETFCIQTAVYFTPGGDYGYTFDNYQITEGTAWLYSQFRANSLGGLNITSAAAAGNSARRDFVFEGQIGSLNPGSGDGAGYDGTAYYNAAQTALNALGISLTTKTEQAFGVETLDLWDSSGNHAQDQLTLAPVPSRRR